MKEPKIGYLPGGEMVRILQAIGDGDALIVRIWEDHYGVEREGHAEYASVVFDQPPVAKYDIETQAALQNLADINAEISVARDRERDVVAELEALQARCAAIPILKDVLAFVEGKITHYVTIYHGDIKIMTLEESMNSEDWNNKGRGRLLTLAPSRRNNGQVEWALNQYRDGSGSDTECIPCLSFEHAVETARAAWRELATGEDLSSWVSDNLLDCAPSLGIELPRDMAITRAKARIESAERQFSNHEQELNKRRAVLEEARAELASLE